MNDIRPITYPAPYIPTTPTPSDLRCQACDKPIEVQGLILHLAFNGSCNAYYRGLTIGYRYVRLTQQNWGYWTELLPL